MATRSADGLWLVGTFSHDAGNVWTNPDLTRQHADPSAPLAPGGRVVLEEKTLVIRGLEDALAIVRRERPALRP